MVMKFSKSRAGRIALVLLSVVLIGLKLFGADVYANERSVDYYEGHRLWVEFLDRVEGVRDVEGWYNNAAGANNFNEGGHQLTPRTFFTERLGYGNEDVWNNLDLFDRFIWTNVYIEPLLQVYYNANPLLVMVMGSFHRDFFENYEGLSPFLNEVGTTHFHHILQSLAAPSAITAYENLMTWQYHHIMATGTAFDFVMGRQAQRGELSLDILTGQRTENTELFHPNIVPVEVIPPHPSLFGFRNDAGNDAGFVDTDQYDPDDVEIPDEVLDGMLGILDGAADAMDNVGNAIGGLINTETDRGIWDNFLAFFGNNIIILIILGVLLLSLGAFVVIKKKRALK